MALNGCIFNSIFIRLYESKYSIMKLNIFFSGYVQGFAVRDVVAWINKFDVDIRQPSKEL